jgi:hypothetical protein
MSKRTLERRLDVLAKSHRFRITRPPSPEDLLFLKKFDVLLAQMDPRDAGAVANELATNDIHGCTDFTLQVLTVVVDHVQENRPLAFPEAVAELFRKGENGYSGAWCLACRYRLNLAHFSECPLCGGKVGYSAIATDMSA